MTIEASAITGIPLVGTNFSFRPESFAQASCRRWLDREQQRPLPTSRGAHNMSFLLACPNCGRRPVDEYAYGGEVTIRADLLRGRAAAASLPLLPNATPPATSASGGSTRPAAASGSRPSATPPTTRCCRSRPPGAARVPDPRWLDHGGELIDRSRADRVHVAGRPHTGYAGDTIASALFAAGIRVFSRSFKYHRRARPDVLRRPVPQLPGRGGRRADRARVHDADRAGHAGLSTSTPGRRWSATSCTWSAGSPPASACRSASTTRPSSARGGRGSYYEKLLRTRRRPGQARPRATAARARFEKVHRHVDVLVIGRRRGRARSGRRRGRARAATRGAGGRGPCPGRAPRLRRAAQAARRAELVERGPRRRRRDPAAGLRRRRLRGQPRARLPGRHDAPLPAGRAGARHRRDRAAAGVRAATTCPA